MRPRAGVALLVALLVAASSLVLSATPAAAEPAALSPAGPYRQGTEVTVRAQGFTPYALVLLAQCRGPADTTPAPSSCASADTGAARTVSADADGAATGTITVAVGEIAPGVSCSAAECVITAVEAGRPTAAAVSSIELTGAAGPGTSTGATEPSATGTPSPTGSQSAGPTGTSSTGTSPATTKPARSGGDNKDNAGAARCPDGSLACTGPEAASTSLLFAIIALQLGLVIAWRFRDRRRRSAHGG